MSKTLHACTIINVFFLAAKTLILNDNGFYEYALNHISQKQTITAFTQEQLRRIRF